MKISIIDLLVVCLIRLRNKDKVTRSLLLGNYFVKRATDYRDYAKTFYDKIKER